MTALNKTQALKQASASVSIHGSGTSWIIIGPHRIGNLAGPTCELTADSYGKARRVAAAWKAEITLRLMGRMCAMAADEIEHASRFEGIANTRQLVAIGLKA